MQPSVASIEKICKGLDITLAQFFSYENQDNTLTTSQQDILEVWKYLNDPQKKALLDMLKSFIPAVQ